MSAPELVRLTIDGVSVEVPKGTGLVEAALAAGIEIPVFCYEPRLGAPVGACRMCLCQVEPGPPKPQAACTLTAQEGMVVRTALTSPVAADAQNATLEFILVNHPLDCPVCDKGGECPLQDLTFRYGPGNTRMTFPKRTFEKPIPVSPLIALDRERCILCYRCTRFSEGVAEDGQLVAVDRGAGSMIATFGDEPYRAPFSGNVIELCPVGALTSTKYRFEARPWEIQDVPTVCGLCPVGLQRQRDDPRRQGQADPLPQPRRGRQRLALRQGPVRVQPPARRGPTAGPAAASAASRIRGGLVGACARRGRASAPRGERADRHRAVRLGDGRAGLCARQAPAPRPRLAHSSVRRRGVGCARSVPHAAVVDPRRRRRRSAGRRADRRAGSDRRPLDQGSATSRRTRALRARRRGRARREERDPRLVRPGWSRRRDRRGARATARRKRRLLHPRDRERTRRLRCVGLRGRHRAVQPGSGRPADRLR